MYLVIDTTIPLHYKSIDQIDWSEISGFKNPTVYVPLVVIEELDKQKDHHKLRKIRERARKALALIYENTDENLSGRLKNKVQLIVESKDPEIDWEDQNLDKNKPDHRVIASALSLASDSNQVAVVQRDYGIRLTLRRLRLRSIELPSHLQLGDAFDESDRELRELRLENERLKSQSPKLCLESEEESNRGLIVMDPKLSPYSKTEQEKILQSLRKEYPLMEVRNTRGGPSSSPLAFIGMEITDKQRKFYNDNLRSFYKEHIDWLIKTREIKNKRSLLTQLELWVLNRGSCPAHDVDVEIRFPSWVSVLLEVDTLDLPSKPEPPERPKPAPMDLIYRPISPLPQALFTDPSIYTPPLTRFQPTSDLTTSKASIYEDESGACVAMHWNSIKHGYRDQILPIPQIKFESYETLRGFQLEYLISAANLPSPTEGAFDVEVKVNQPE